MSNLQLYSQEYVGAQVVSMVKHVNLVSGFNKQCGSSIVIAFAI